jgi:hypothetical protein
MLHVTHHALVRYLERVRGFKFDREREAIQKICAGIKDGSVKAHGCIFEIRNGTVVSICPDGPYPNATKRAEVFAKAIS